MAKPPKKPKLENIETEPGAWGRFERTVKRMLDTPPKPHKPSKVIPKSKDVQRK